MAPRASAEPSARTLLRSLARGELSARELVQQTIARIETADARLHAVACRDDEAALAAADRADELRRSGASHALLGLPVTIKDSLATAGLATSCGSLARAGHVPATDATVVARLKAAGAVVVAKTTVPEYTWSYETESVLHGRTTNPWSPERTCGGSSGGEAALLGADASVVGVGTDAGGSIRVPSHYCGTVGLRPTAGLVPETGCWPPTRDTGLLDINAVGPMARFVEDLSLLLPVLSGADGVDPFVHGVRPGDPEATELRGLRVGFMLSDGVVEVSEATATAVERAGRALEHAGCDVEPATPPDLAQATELFFALMAADGGARARHDLAPAHGRHVEQLGSLLEHLRPLGLGAADYFALLRRAFAFRARVRAFVDRFDVVLAPVTAGPAPPHGCTPGDETPLTRYDAFNYTHAYSIAGLPVAVVRAGRERGLPIGVQVVAGAFRDHVALAAAAALEQELGAFAGSADPEPAGRAV
jgi:amidase